MNVDILLLIAVGLLLLGVLPLYPYSNRWGYTPSAVLAVVFIAVLVFIFI
jgi:hypothetical protein